MACAVTELECDHPPADYATRMRRAKNLGSEADYLARRERFYEERIYKRMLAIEEELRLWPSG